MIDDRKEQAAAIARARANPLQHLPLAAQDAVSHARSRQGERAANQLAKAFSDLPPRERHIPPNEALRLADERERASLDGFMAWQAANCEPAAFGEE